MFTYAAILKGNPEDRISVGVIRLIILSYT